MLKCSRCRHIFPGPTTPPVKSTPDSIPGEPDRRPDESPSSPPENLAFSFSDQPLKEPQPKLAPKPPPTQPPPDFVIDEPEPEFELGTEPAPSSPGGREAAVG